MELCVKEFSEAMAFSAASHRYMCARRKLLRIGLYDELEAS
jgi:hypothetical protein